MKADLSASVYFSVAFVLYIDKGYTLLLDKVVPGSRAKAQSHGLCGGSCEVVKHSGRVVRWL